MVLNVLFNDPWIIRHRKNTIRVKKTHTVKNNIISTPGLSILYLSETYQGSIHDKAICDEEFTAFPCGIKLHQDTGFQGQLPQGVAVIQPLRKPRGKDLTGEQKQENKAKSSVRVVVEHAIGRVKICRIVKDRIRLWKPQIKDKVMQICCGLHNFRLSEAIIS